MPEPRPFVEGHGLIVGVGGDLPMTVADAQALRDVLIDPGRGAYPPDQLELLVGTTATREAVLGALDRLAKRVAGTPDATVVVYFSGHGGRIERPGARPEHFLVPHGYDPARRAETAISGRELTDRVEALRARRLVVLLDCCHAGGIKARPSLALEKETFVEAPVPPELVARLEEGSGQVVVASSHEEEYSYTSGAHSVFTECLLEALTGAGDRYARVLDVLSYLFREVPRRAAGPQRPFVTKVTGLGENFALCYHGRPAVGWFTPEADSTLEALTADLLGSIVGRMKEGRKRFPQDLQRNPLDFYVEARGAPEPPPRERAGAGRGEPLEDLLQESLRAARPTMVLAEFGMGKTWFLETMQYRLAEAAEPEAVARGESWIPLVLKLRDFRYERQTGLGGIFGAILGATPKSAFEQLRDQAFTAAFGELAASRHREELLRMFEEGRFLFLLDGLDEISIASREDANALLGELGRIGSHVRRSPVVVTCRRSFFQGSAQEASVADRGFDVVYLWPWAPEDFLLYLTKAHDAGVVDAEPEQVLAKIESIHDLADVTGRALLSAMVVDQWDAVVADEVVDVPSLYEHYIEKGILDWQSRKAQRLREDELQMYMEELAFLMFSLDSLTIAPGELDDYFSRKFRELGVERFSSVAESLVRDVRTNSFLTRSDDKYTFCHTSLWEFLVARKLARDLAAGDRGSLEVPTRSAQYRSIVTNFLVPMLRRQGRLDAFAAQLAEP